MKNKSSREMIPAEPRQLVQEWDDSPLFPDCVTTVEKVMTSIKFQQV
jgi:hypothetical protein